MTGEGRTIYREKRHGIQSDAHDWKRSQLASIMCHLIFKTQSCLSHLMTLSSIKFAINDHKYSQYSRQLKLTEPWSRGQLIGIFYSNQDTSYKGNRHHLQVSRSLKRRRKDQNDGIESDEATLNPDEEKCPTAKRKADGENREPMGPASPYLTLTKIYTRKHLANHAR